MVDYEKLRRIPSKIFNMVKALYAEFECAVVDGHDTTEWFKIKTGVKQGCNMSGEYRDKMEVHRKARGSRLCG